MLFSFSFNNYTQMSRKTRFEARIMLYGEMVLTGIRMLKIIDHLDIPGRSCDKTLQESIAAIQLG